MSGGLTYCCLHSTDEAGPPAWLPSTPGSSEGEKTAQSFLRGITCGPLVQMDSPRTFPFLPLRQGTGRTLDPASCLPGILTLCHSVSG